MFLATPIFQRLLDQAGEETQKIDEEFSWPWSTACHPQVASAFIA